MNTKFSTKISCTRNKMMVILTYHHPCTIETRKRKCSLILMKKTRGLSYETTVIGNDKICKSI